MRRIARILVPLFAFAAIATPAALGAERMWIGFHDDPSFRWVDDRMSRIELVTWAPLITLTVLLGLWPGLLLQQWVAL